MMKEFALLLLCLCLAAAPVGAYRKDGWPCRATFQCASEYCNSTLQCDAKKDIGASCPNNHDACISGRCSGGVCQVQQPEGGPCAVHEDCNEGYCSVETSTCLAWKGREVQCIGDFECRSGICTRNPLTCTFTVKDQEICGRDAECEGGRCKKKDGLNRCYDRKWNGHFCNHNEDCWSLRCEGVAPARNCTEPVWLGEPCDEPSDCYSLFCNKEQGLCVASEAEAGSDPELIPDEPGIAGSNTVSVVNNGGGTVDITGGSGGDVFVVDPGSSNTGAAIATCSISWLHSVAVAFGVALAAVLN